MKKNHCKVFSHHLHLTRHVTQYVKEYRCKNCKKQFTTDNNGQLIELTPKFKKINDILERTHNHHIIKMSKENNLVLSKH